MNKTKNLISELGITTKKIAEVLNISVSGVHSKMREHNGNRFTENDYRLIVNFLVSSISKFTTTNSSPINSKSKLASMNSK